MKFHPDLIKSERAMGYLTGSLGYRREFCHPAGWHFFTQLDAVVWKCYSTCSKVHCCYTLNSIHRPDYFRQQTKIFPNEHKQ